MERQHRAQGTCYWIAVFACNHCSCWSPQSVHCCSEVPADPTEAHAQLTKLQAAQR